MARPRNKNTGLPPYVYLKNGAYRYQVPAHLKQRLLKSWISLGKTTADMWTAYSKLQADLNNDGGMAILFERYTREVIPGKAPRTQIDNKREMKNLMAVFGKMEPELITQAMAYQYLDIRGQTSRTQANHEMALLRHVFTHAVSRGWCSMQSNPLQGMHKLPVAVRDRTPSPDEFRAVRAHADAMMVLWMDLKWQTGLRQGDMLTIKLADLKPEGIRVKPNKNAKNGLIEWDDDLRGTVAAILAFNGVQGMTLFCDERGRPMQQRTIQSKFRRAVLAAIAAGDLQESFSENDIRSSFATESEVMGLDATNQLLHKSGNAKKHYVHRKTTRVTPMKRV